MKTIFQMRHAWDQPKTVNAAQRAGFTLMEVNAALVIVAVGLMGLLALFPVGLHQGDAATADTTEAAFADMVLNAMRANAQTLTNNTTDWTTWKGLATTDPSKLVDHVVSGSLGSGTGFPTPTHVNDGKTNEITDYLIQGQYIAYIVNVLNGPGGANDRTKMVCIQVTNRKYTDVSHAPIYATSFVYMGM